MNRGGGVARSSRVIKRLLSVVPTPRFANLEIDSSTYLQSRKHQTWNQSVLLLLEVAFLPRWSTW